MLRMACERYLCQSYNLSVGPCHLVKRGPFLTSLPNFRIYWSGVDQILSLELFRYLLGFYFHMSLKGGYVSWRACALRLCKLLSKFYCFLRVTFSVTSKAPKFTETFTSELGLDKGYFDSIYGTFPLCLC